MWPDILAAMDSGGLGLVFLEGRGRGSIIWMDLDGGTFRLVVRMISVPSGSGISKSFDVWKFGWLLKAFWVAADSEVLISASAEDVWSNLELTTHWDLLTSVTFSVFGGEATLTGSALCSGLAFSSFSHSPSSLAGDEQNKALGQKCCKNHGIFTLPILHNQTL